MICCSSISFLGALVTLFLKLCLFSYKWTKCFSNSGTKIACLCFQLLKYCCIFHNWITSHTSLRSPISPRSPLGGSLDNKMEYQTSWFLRLCPRHCPSFTGMFWFLVNHLMLKQIWLTLMKLKKCWNIYWLLKFFLVLLYLLHLCYSLLNWQLRLQCWD